MPSNSPTPWFPVSALTTSTTRSLRAPWLKKLQKYGLGPWTITPGRGTFQRFRKSLRLERKVVGAVRFELTTPCAQGRCATRLRYAPTDKALLMLNHFREMPSSGVPVFGATVLKLCQNSISWPSVCHNSCGLHWPADSA